VLFWQKHRAAMNAMKVDGDYPRAITLFREALALNPNHEDALYYLAHCLAEQGQVEEALEHLAKLQRLNPQSHRAFQQWGALRARTARETADLDAAARALARAHQLNPEETGALRWLGEIELMRGLTNQAAAHLADVTHTNSKSVGALFLQGYLAWKRGDAAAAKRFLESARAALGPEWKPEGATAEGDVRRRMHRDPSPLSRFWEKWNGAPDPPHAFADLDAFLRQSQAKD